MLLVKRRPLEVERDKSTKCGDSLLISANTCKHLLRGRRALAAFHEQFHSFVMTTLGSWNCHPQRGNKNLGILNNLTPNSLTRD